MRQRPPDDFGLLVNLLDHEMPVIALVHQIGTGAALEPRTLDNAIIHIPKNRTVSGQHNPITFLKIGDCIRERREC